MTLLQACKVALDALGCDRTRQDRLEAQKIINAAISESLNERDERDTVEDCPHDVRERDAHLDNPTCAHCSVADECTEVLPF